jgi:hypothetical protein
MRLVRHWSSLALLLAAAELSGAAQSKLASLGADGRLHYTAYTEQGDRLPDFSHCGYGGGGVPLPEARIQSSRSPGKETMPRGSSRPSTRSARCRPARTACAVRYG